MATATIEKDPAATSSWLDRPVALAFSLDLEKLAYLALIVLGFVTRFYDLGARVMSHDESLHTQFSWYLYEGKGFSHTPMMHGPLKFEVTAFLYWMFGDNDFTARMSAALMGVIAIGLMWYFRRWLGRAGALAAAAFLLISPYQLYYARYIRDEPYVMVWGLLLALFVFNYMETRQPKFIYALTAIMALFYATMESSYIYVAITLVFLGVFFLAELVVNPWPRPELKKAFWTAGSVMVGAALVGVALFLLNDRLGLTGTAFAPEAANPDEPALRPATMYTIAADIAFLVALVAGVFTLGLVMRAFGRRVRNFASLDLIMALGIFVLPQAAALPVMMLGYKATNYVPPAMVGMDTPDFIQNLTVFFTQYLPIFLTSDFGVTAIVTAFLIAASIVLGYIWNWNLFATCALIFYGLYIPLYTTFFTNPAGVATGLVGSLGYWMEQHGVRRGGQPWYYYLLINIPMYEYLPAIGAISAGVVGLLALINKGFEPLRLLVDWRAQEPADPAPLDPQTAVATRSLPEGVGTYVGPDDPIPAEAPIEDWHAPADNSWNDSAIAQTPRSFPALLYIGWWAVMAFIGFSIAGEKMPWLTTHICLPMILLSGWVVGRLIDGIRWSDFKAQRVWLVAALVPATLLAALTALGMLLGDSPPFAGAELTQVQNTTAFFSVIFIAILGCAALYTLGAPLGWPTIGRLGGLAAFAILSVTTARTAFVAAYINYDLANEFLVYAHGARGVKTVMAQIDEIAERTADGQGLKVAYDADVSWPMTWYLRDYTNQVFYGSEPNREQLRDVPVIIAGASDWGKIEPLVRNDYYQFEYIRMVWPMQDYFINETPITTRVWDNLISAEKRQALWDIWWDRDYTKYGELSGASFDLAQWNPADRMRLYVRKDIAAKIWSYGVGASAEAQQAVDPYASGKLAVAPVLAIGSEGNGAGLFNAPRGVAFAADGSFYVADSRNHRIQHFSAAGELLNVFGEMTPLDPNTTQPLADAPAGTFTEPWGVAVGPDGSVYVSDTWNHRIQKFDADGNFIAAWGRFGQSGVLDEMWGPRGIAVSATGRVFVADTGNKRVIVFDEQGNGVTAIGSYGFEDGQLDEPVGVAVGADGAVYVADTWNQRVQKFVPQVLAGEGVETYVFVLKIDVNGWFGQSLDNKPFVAVDGQGRIYITDPEGFRLVVFGPDGVYRNTIGEAGDQLLTLLSAVAVADDGTVLVSEPGANRVITFAPLP